MMRWNRSKVNKIIAAVCVSALLTGAAGPSVWAEEAVAEEQGAGSGQETAAVDGAAAEDQEAVSADGAAEGQETASVEGQVNKVPVFEDIYAVNLADGGFLHSRIAAEALKVMCTDQKPGGTAHGGGIRPLLKHINILPVEDRLAGTCVAGIAVGLADGIVAAVELF